MCLYWIPPFSLVPLSTIHIDAKALCEPAGSLKQLTLEVTQSCSTEALAEVFECKPLENLDLSLRCAVEVSRLCSVDCEGLVYMNALKLD